jgi:hypothetical protein
MRTRLPVLIIAGLAAIGALTPPANAAGADGLKLSLSADRASGAYTLGDTMRLTAT